MSNPKLRGYPLVGGPLDGGRVTLLPDYPDGDEAEPVPPRWIQIEQDGYITISRRSPADIIRQEKSTIYLAYQLAALVLEGDEKHYRYLYAAAGHFTVEGWHRIFKTGGAITLPPSPTLGT